MQRVGRPALANVLHTSVTDRTDTFYITFAILPIMAKMKKFSIAQSGTLVYRTSGKAYRGEYTLKTTPTGVINVYGKDGRRMGTVAAPTSKKAQREIERLDKRRKVNQTGRAALERSKQVKDDRRWQRTYSDIIKENYQGYDVPADTWEARDTKSWSTHLDKYYLGGSLEKYFEVFNEITTKHQQSLQNFAKVMEDNINRTVTINGEEQPLVSVEEANIMFSIYQDALAREDWDVIESLWADMAYKAQEYGFEISDPVVVY